MLSVVASEPLLDAWIASDAALSSATVYGLCAGCTPEAFPDEGLGDRRDSQGDHVSGHRYRELADHLDGLARPILRWSGCVSERLSRSVT